MMNKTLPLLRSKARKDNYVLILIYNNNNNNKLILSSLIPKFGSAIRVEERVILPEKRAVTEFDVLEIKN